MKVFKRNFRSFALALPGQGIVRPGLLKSYASLRHSVLKDEIKILDKTLGNSFTENLFGDQNPNWLSRTSNAQPAILTASYFLYIILKRQYNVDLVPKHIKFMLGHSLGEYTALLINGNIGYEFALNLVSKRGKLMEDLVNTENHGGNFGMRAILCRPNSFDSLLELFSDAGILANINNRNQIVVSGEVNKIDKVIEEINNKEKRLILKNVKLPVSIPFHNKILSVIQPKLSELCTGHYSKGKVPIISNMTGLPTMDTDTLISNTIEVNSKPVQWVKSMEFLIKTGEVTDIINFGPGDVLQGINSKFSIKNHKINSIEDMEEFVKYIEQ